MKKSLALIKSTAIPNDKKTNNCNMPNQYVRVKNVAKGEDVIKENTGQNYAFVDNSSNTKSDYSSDIKVDLVEQGIPKLSFF
jgi:hypothetical protein